ncbi:hypothetical protein T492DRAFT_857196 [Pavlovales sp. CCMP2436]|nr:hypothetical protein T492DRAFT_857196 [Pavlovales sp. CCMP2436]
MSLLRTMMEDTIMRDEAQALIQLVGVFAIIDVTEIIPERHLGFCSGTNW